MIRPLREESRMVRKYGKPIRKTRAELLFAELPKSPLKTEDSQPSPLLDVEYGPGTKTESVAEDILLEANVLDQIRQQLESVSIIDDEDKKLTKPQQGDISSPLRERRDPTAPTPKQLPPHIKSRISHHPSPPPPEQEGEEEDDAQEQEEAQDEEDVGILTWDDVCTAGDTIQKIAEASYAEVYRITNERGTSIIKVIRLHSPIKPQTKTQQKSGLVDEEPHSEEDLAGELQISEWLADVPGFVVYKERYVVQGKAPKVLLDTHQAFHRKMKRQDPDRLQFYPSPSRYLDDTKFLVVELGDAGTALEGFVLHDIDQVWDIFLHTAIALARAEELIKFEHRDLHEGNLCIRQARPPKPRPQPTHDTTLIDSENDNPHQFGYSGLGITILDYGLSRGSDPDYLPPSPPPSSSSTGSPSTTVFSDLEKDLTLFTSTHAPQCHIYRLMRTYLLSNHSRPSRKHPYLLHPELHATPYEPDPTTGQPTISWRDHHSYTNVLWLAYLYGFLTEHYVSCAGGGKAGKKRAEEEVAGFKEITGEMWTHLNPAASRRVLSFSSAVDVVRYAVEAGWVGEEQLMEEGADGGLERSMLSFVGGDGTGNESVIGEGDMTHPRRSPRRKTRGCV